jgi:hypothetical protein
VIPYFGEYLAELRRQDLLREAQQAALAAKATSADSSLSDRALQVAANLLADTGRRLQADLCRKRHGREPSAPPAAVCAVHHGSPHAVLGNGVPSCLAHHGAHLGA